MERQGKTALEDTTYLLAKRPAGQFVHVYLYGAVVCMLPVQYWLVAHVVAAVLPLS